MHSQKVLDLLVLCIVILCLECFHCYVIIIDCCLTLVILYFSTLVALINHLLTYLLTYLCVQICAYAPTRALRSSTSKLLQVPRTNLRFGSCCFCASAPTLWNSLPRSVRFCESLTTFWKHLKTFYFQSAFPGAP